MRVALVTGAARGIGAATVKALVAEGCHVVAVDWCLGEDGPYPQGTREQLEALAVDHPDRVRPHIADVRDAAAMTTAVRVALDTWGRLDVAVAAAGLVAGGGPLWESSTDDLELLWQVNARGVWHTAAAAVPAMLAGPAPSGCRFVAVVSAAGDTGLFHLAGYNASKHAALGIVRGLAADLVGTGVTAVAVSPGSTETAMLRRTAELYDVTTDELASHQLLGRPLAPEELAATVAHCASALGGAALNGSVVKADGGFR